MLNSDKNNVDRIPVMIEKLGAIWPMYPSMRLVQLVHYIASIELEDDDDGDLYYAEDNAMIEAMDILLRPDKPCDKT